MDARDFIQRQVASVRRTSDAVTGDLKDEQLSWAPPGTANSIAATLLHTIVSEDSFIQARLQGKPVVFDSQEWAKRLGITNPPGRGDGWEEIKTKQLSVATLLAYQQAVHAATDAYLAGLTDAELERKLTLFGGERPVADVLAMMFGHAAHHIGEISALKGIQGVKGLPF